MRAYVFFPALLWVCGCHASMQAGAQVEGSVGGASEGAPAAGGAAVSAENFGPISCNHSVTRLAPGTYRGDLVVSGNHCSVEGAGPEQTIIEGGLDLSGNHNKVSNLTVRKASRISGNHNSASGVTFQSEVKSDGNHNSP